MLAIAVLISCYIGALLLGKQTRHVKSIVYVYIALIALIQAGFILMQMMGMTVPWS